ncbi:DUF6950 family protein [Pararhodobacter zhoushanensis]|uniref:DUF6950 family protein n=1 Tax=Pararhodobacter zhoushanensis TaxID=2479545 RepID=UPI000F8CE03F|nr:hypothetical protein [Pararhodobacter zhoushanensis]
MGRVTRIAGWETILAEQIEAARLRPFQWGVHDCATWAADVRAALTGTESAAQAWRGRYKTEIGAARALRRLGWPDLATGAEAALGAPIPVLMAQRGDVVMDGQTFGVCVGASAAFVGETGLIYARLGQCSAAWRV